MPVLKRRDLKARERRTISGTSRGGLRLRGLEIGLARATKERRYATGWWRVAVGAGRRVSRGGKGLSHSKVYQSRRFAIGCPCYHSAAYTPWLSWGHLVGATVELSTLPRAWRRFWRVGPSLLFWFRSCSVSALVITRMGRTGTQTKDEPDEDPSRKEPRLARTKSKTRAKDTQGARGGGRNEPFTTTLGSAGWGGPAAFELPT